jgi:hypothetical protein
MRASVDYYPEGSAQSVRRDSQRCFNIERELVGDTAKLPTLLKASLSAL